jgi:hypothetical protein
VQDHTAGTDCPRAIGIGGDHTEQHGGDSG